MKRILQRIAFGLLLVSLVGCSTRGREFSEDSVPLIHPGVTDRERVEELFGKPTTIRSSSSGTTTYRYDYTETHTQDTGMLTRLARSIGWIFGASTRVIPPVNLAHSNTEHHRLVVRFDEDGKVVDYTYDRTETPSTRVY